ncbi:hypothetical protein [Paenibacillus campi]|uniref:hypothetical protein n=1 Tax=Paenibacillus campi TaxID=3106031 RepID=UPI002AFF8E6E|nr:hypothetical protein [Paenibacillus sp. SGZ-1014]
MGTYAENARGPFLLFMYSVPENIQTIPVVLVKKIKIAFAQKNVQNESDQTPFWKADSCAKTSSLYTKTTVVTKPIFGYFASRSA